MDEHTEGGIPSPGAAPRRKPHVRRIQPTEGQRKANHIRSEQIKQTGKILPACPMTPDELVEQWNIGADDSLTITVKVMRQVLGDKELVLVKSVPLVEYSGEEIARNFGPGTYYLRPAAGIWARNSAKVPISEELARACGWGRIPVTPQDVQAERTIRKAAEAPTDPMDLLAAVQQVVRRELDAAGIRPGSAPSPGQVQTFNPMEAMQTQMQQMNAWMSFMDRMDAHMQARVERRLGVSHEEPDNKNQSLLEALIPLGMKLLDRMTEGPRMLPVPPRQAGLPQLHQGNTQPQAAPPPPQEEREPMPTLTPEEQQAIAPVVKMLQPFGPQLVAITNTPATDEQIVTELEGYIPENMVGGIVALNAATVKHGKAVLGFIHPGLASDRWAVILPKLCEALS